MPPNAIQNLVIWHARWSIYYLICDVEVTNQLCYLYSCRLFFVCLIQYFKQFNCPQQNIVSVFHNDCGQFKQRNPMKILVDPHSTVSFCFAISATFGFVGNRINLKDFLNKLKNKSKRRAHRVSKRQHTPIATIALCHRKLVFNL